MNNQQTRQLAIAVLQSEASAISALQNRINDKFVNACDMLLQCHGRVVVCGVGKSGHIGGKIAATLASTGTPAFFVHPGEASHGDLGMIRREDVVIAISHSGKTAEILVILPVLKRIGCQLIAMTGNPESTLARAATTHLDVSIEREACPLGLAPTSSTTATLAMGDALAVSVLQCRGFKAEDFAFSHPGGTLGKRLLLTVEDIMSSGQDVPKIPPQVTLKEALVQMSAKKLGFVIVVNDVGQPLGVFTDGDLRRSLDRDIDIYRVRIEEVMTVGGLTISPDQLAVEALKLMETKQIMALPVVAHSGLVCGALNMHSLLRAGVV